MFLTSVCGFCVGVAAPAPAAPEAASGNAASVLTGPVAQFPLRDSAVKKAIEIIRKKPDKSPDKPRRQINKPDSPIGRHNQDRILILGGSEVFPM